MLDVHHITFTEEYPSMMSVLVFTASTVFAVVFAGLSAAVEWSETRRVRVASLRRLRA